MKKKKKEDDPLFKYRQLRRPESGSAAKVFRHETEAAALVGGRRHKGSGALTGLRSDASSKDFQVECKQTEKKSLSLKLEWLEKISMEAAGQSKEPLLHLRFLSAPPGVAKDWICIPEWTFKKLEKKEDDP